MTDFPIANSNPDALWLSSIYHTLGVAPIGSGFSIDTSGVSEPQHVKLPLMEIYMDSISIYGTYFPKNPGSVTIRVLGAWTSNTRCLPLDACHSQRVGNSNAVVFHFEQLIVGVKMEFRVDW